MDHLPSSLKSAQSLSRNIFFSPLHVAPSRYSRYLIDYFMLHWLCVYDLGGVLATGKIQGRNELHGCHALNSLRLISDSLGLRKEGKSRGAV